METKMDALAFLADARGANAVCVFLQENRKHACALLDALAQPVLLDPATAPHTTTTAAAAAVAGKDTGVYMEQRLSLRAQREVWSALARLPYSVRDPHHDPHAQAALDLARRFLQCTNKKRACAPDAVCCSLAQMVVSAAASAMHDAPDARVREVDDDESLASIQRNAAFREAMKQLTLTRFAVPSIDDLTALSAAAKSGSVGASSGVAQPERPVLLRFTRVQAPSPTLSTTTGASAAQLLLGSAPSNMAAASESRRSRDTDDAELQPTSSSTKRARVGEHSLQPTEPTYSTISDKRASAAPIQLSPEIEERATKLAKQLAGSDAQASRVLLDEVTRATVQLIQDTINATTATQTATELLLARLCETLQLAACSDEAIFQIATALVESSWSSRHASVFLETSVFPKIAAAASVISRVLLQTALLFSARYASALLDALLIPLLTTRAIGAAQGEAITRILRNGVPLEQIDGFLTLMVLQNVLTMKAPLSDATIDRFVACCEAAQDDQRGADALYKSLKFATLVFTMVSKYPEQCAAHAEGLEAIAKRLTSLMAKSTMRAVLKLKASGTVAR